MGACQAAEAVSDPEVAVDDEPPPRSSPAVFESDDCNIDNMEDYDPEARLCKFACGKRVQPGETRRGKKFDTCCRMCAINKGGGFHDATCGGKSPPPVDSRKACGKGSKCRDRSEAHLKAMAHPLDEDVPCRAVVRCCVLLQSISEPSEPRVARCSTWSAGSHHR
eukprot:s569_g21.t3